MKFHAESRVELEIDVDLDGGLESDLGSRISDLLHAAGCAHAGTALELLRYHGFAADMSYRGGNVGKGPVA